MSRVANFARGLLQSAVPASLYDQACEVLECELSEEDLIAQAEAEANRNFSEDMES